MSNVIVEETPLVSYKVVKNDDGEFFIGVKVHGQTVNEWNLGNNEEIAQSKSKTIIDTYLKGLEFVQQQVRTAFTEAEDVTEVQPSSEPTS